MNLAKLFGGIFSRIEEYGGSVCASPLYSRAVRMMETYIDKGLDNSVLEDELVDWIGSEVLDDLKKDSSFTGICDSGHLEIAKWFVERFPKKDVHGEVEEPFFRLCSRGYLDFIKWFVEKFPETDVHVCREGPFIGICDQGHLEVAKWFVKKYPETDIHARNERAFRFACENGHLEVAKWLVDCSPALSRKAVDLYADNNDAFLRTCRRGHLEVAKWLFPHYGFTHIFEGKCFELACESGNIEFVVWLSGVIEYRDVQSGFLTACLAGKLDMIKYLVKTYPEIEVDQMEDMGFRLACKKSHLDVAKWFLRTYPDTSTERVYLEACKKGNKKIRELIEQYEPKLVRQNV